MQIETYSGKYDDEIISLILDIQNHESKINLSLEEQQICLQFMTLIRKMAVSSGLRWIRGR